MISLRQHIFSLVAVFVALAIGIAAGSTVVRGPLLDSTRARLESTEDLIALERAENDALAGELGQLDDWVVDGPNQLLDRRLAGSAVMLIVAGSVDDDVVDGVIRSLRATSGEFVGELRVDSAVFDPEQAPRVRKALGAVAESSESATVESVAGGPGDVEAARQFGRALAVLVSTVATGITDGASGPGGGGAGDIAVDALLRSAFGGFEDAGLVDLLEVNRQPIVATDVVVMVLTDRNVAFDPAPVLDGVITMSDPAGAGLTVLVAEVGRVDQDNENPTPSFVLSLRDSGRLRDEVSTVDNAETVLGWIAGVLGLDAARSGVIGHYGFRGGADRAIPSRTQ